MRILSYSDLHLEFDHNWILPQCIEGDVLVLAGDIITFKDYAPLERLLQNWQKPVLYVPGNHEYYTQTPMDAALDDFIVWAKKTMPNIQVLNNESTIIEEVHFFGGTMWTDFEQENVENMEYAGLKMNDFKFIKNEFGGALSPQDMVFLHREFVEKVKSWLGRSQNFKRVIVSHHAPLNNPDVTYLDDALKPAFVSSDILPIIERHQPDLWIYGHTHECDDRIVGQTRIISNQLGYPNGLGGFNASNFDGQGRAVNL